MKKTLLILTVILGCVFILFSVLGRKGEYLAEKKFWKINKKFEEIRRDPKAVPEASFEAVLRDYEKFIKKFHHSKLVPLAYIYEGQVYLIKKDYDKSRTKFEEIIRKYADKPGICVRAVSEISRTYALEEDWDHLLSTYQRIVRDYPLTGLGFQTPITIAQFYLSKNKPLQAQNAFAEAITHYQKLMDENPDKPLVEFNALRALAICHMAQKRWEKAVEIFGKVLLKFANSPYLNERNAVQIAKWINTISVAQLGNIQLPVSIYQQFINENPNHPFRKTLEDYIRGFETLKQKNESPK